MSEAVLISIITAAGLILSGMISAVIANNLIKYRLESLEKKVDQHNGYAEKFTEASKDIALIQQDIKWIKQSMEVKS